MGHGEDLCEPPVCGRLGEIDAVEADAIVEAERTLTIETDHAHRGRALDEARGEAPPDGGPQTGDRDDARSAQCTRPRLEDWTQQPPTVTEPGVLTCFPTPGARLDRAAPRALG